MTPFKSDEQRKGFFAGIRSSASNPKGAVIKIKAGIHKKFDEHRAKKVLKEKQYDVTGNIIAYESGELSDDDTIKLFQHLEDSGQAYQLQGSYGRTAMNLIANGLIKPNPAYHSKEQIEHEKTRLKFQRAFEQKFSMFRVKNDEYVSFDKFSLIKHKKYKNAFGKIKGFDTITDEKGKTYLIDRDGTIYTKNFKIFDEVGNIEINKNRIGK